jgi:hypothetical protein
VIGRLIGGDHPKGDILAATPLNRLRGPHPDRIGATERGQVKLVDDLQHEPRQ